MGEIPPIELLPALCALLETESVTRAAQALHVGQPAMSRKLAQLREALGDELLVRSGRGLVRTRRADELLPEARALLAATTKLLEPARSFDPACADGAVTVALGDDMQAMLVTRLLGRLRAEAPGLDVRIRSIGLHSAGDLVRGIVDVAVLPDIRHELEVPVLDELVMRPQYTRSFVTVSRRRKKLSLGDFLRAEHVLVSPQGDASGYVDSALRTLGKRRRIAVTVPTFPAVFPLLMETELIATFPDDVARALAPRLHRQPCPVPTPQLEMCVLWAPRFARDPRHLWLREQVIRAVRALDPQT